LVGGVAILDDERLTLDVRHGDAAAWDELYRRYAPSVRAVCIKYVRDPETAADLVHDTFERALRRVSGLDPSTGRLGPWLRVIARNTCLNWLRRQGREVELLDESEDRLAVGPEGTYEAAERSEQVRAAFMALTDRDRRILIQRHVMDQDVPTMARENGLTPGSMSVVLSKARAQLRDHVPSVHAWIASPFVLLRHRLRDVVQRLADSGGLDPLTTALAGAAVMSVVVLALPGVLGDRPEPEVDQSAEVATSMRRPPLVEDAPNSTGAGPKSDTVPTGPLQTDPAPQAHSLDEGARLTPRIPGTRLEVVEQPPENYQHAWHVSVGTDLGGSETEATLDGYGEGISSSIIMTVCEDDINVVVASCHAE
jgi:RNA polymerase sigma-70 factor (ECF subfamily)